MYNLFHIRIAHKCTFQRASYLHGFFFYILGNNTDVTDYQTGEIWSPAQICDHRLLGMQVQAERPVAASGNKWRCSWQDDCN